MTALDPALLTLATHQSSMITVGQARALGISAAALRDLVRAKVLQHPARGLYAVATLCDPTPEGRHRQLCAGALLLYPDGALSGVSAVVAHGLPVFGVDLSRPQVRRPPDRARGVKGVRVLKSLREVDLSAPVRCEPLDLALTELAIEHGIVAGTVSADAALHGGLVTMETLSARVEQCVHWPRSARARAMVAFADARAESVGETRTRILLETHGIRLTSQVVLSTSASQRQVRVDFVVTGTRVVIEFDGRKKYAEGAWQTLWDEKRREDWIRAQGYAVVRLTWADLENPERALAKVRRALAAAAA